MIRHFLPSDSDTCQTLLAAEGISTSEMCFAQGITGVMDQGGVRGFFTLELTDGIPSLRHFCLDRQHRTFTNALRLMRGVREIVRRAGFAQMLVHAKREKLRRLVEWYFRAAPYKQSEDGSSLYLVRV